MSRFTVTAVLALAAGPVAPAAMGAGTLLWGDNFNAYPDQASLLANYVGSGSSNTGGPTSQFFDLGVPTPDGGNTTQSVRYHDPLTAGTTMPDLARDINSTSIKATDAVPILWQYDFYWDGLGNKRVTSGLRNIGVGHVLREAMQAAKPRDIGDGFNVKCKDRKHVRGRAAIDKPVKFIRSPETAVLGSQRSGRSARGTDRCRTVSCGASDA